MQEDKEALFDSVDTIKLLLPVVTAIINTLNARPEKMRAALEEEMLATDMADYLVHKGLPFRQAHHIIGEAVRMAASRGVKLSQIPLGHLKELSELFEEDVADVFNFDESVARRKATGGTAPEAVAKQIEAAKSWLETQQQ